MNTLKLQQALHKIIFYLLLLTPLVVFFKLKDLAFPYVTSKVYFFRILVQTVFSLWLLLIYLNKHYLPRWNWISKALLLQLGLMLLADLLGLNFERSFWSDYSRMDGLVTHLHLIIYFFALSTFFTTKNDWKNFTRISVVCSVAIGIYTILQKNGILDVTDMSRPDATFGNPIYLAIYAAFHMLLSMSYLVQKNEKKIVTLLYSIALAINLIALFLTKTRGTVLALTLSAGFYFLYVASTKKNKIIFLRTFIKIIAVIVFLIGATYVFDKSFSDRIMAAVHYDYSTNARLQLWQTSFKSIKEYPILGIGQENHIYLAKYYNPKNWAEPWFDRSHNVIVDQLVNFGVLGLLSYLLIYLIVLYYIFKIDLNFSFYKRALILTLLICHFIHVLFAFDSLTSSMFFYALLAYIQAQTISQSAFEPKNKSIFKLALAIIVILMVSGLTQFFVNIQDIKTNIQLISFLKDSKNLPKNPSEFKNTFNQILHENVFVPTFTKNFLVGVCDILLDQPQINPDVFYPIYNYIVDETQKRYAKDPNDIYPLYLLGMLYNRIGSYPAAEKMFKDVLNISPNRQDVMIDLGSVYLNQKQYDLGLQYYKNALLLDPAYPIAELYYVLGLSYNQKPNDMITLIDSMITDNKPHIYDLRLIRALSENKFYGQIIKLVESKIQLPNSEYEFDTNTIALTSNDLILLQSAYQAVGQLTDQARITSYLNTWRFPVIKRLRQ